MRLDPRLPILLVLLLGADLACSSRHPLEGARAPEVELPDLAGQRHSLAGLLTVTTVLTFWTDCIVCRSELPLVASAVRQSKGKLGAVGINSRETPEQVRAMADQLGLDFPGLLDRGQQAETSYQVVTAPTAFLIEPPGQILEVQVGRAGYDLAWRRR